MEIKSREPGKIVRFEKQVGDQVAVRDVLIVMERSRHLLSIILWPKVIVRI